jgi:hypothetical protein
LEESFAFHQHKTQKQYATGYNNLSKLPTPRISSISSQQIISKIEPNQEKNSDKAKQAKFKPYAISISTNLNPTNLSIFNWKVHGAR